MTQEEWVLRDGMKGRAKGENIEKSKVEEARGDKRKKQRGVGKSLAFHSI